METYVWNHKHGKLDPCFGSPSSPDCSVQILCIAHVMGLAVARVLTQVGSEALLLSRLVVSLPVGVSLLRPS
jgi:hypothetical protein